METEALHAQSTGLRTYKVLEQLFPSSVCCRIPLVMGVLNLTPDSYYAKSRYYQDKQYALDKALEMVDAGVNIIDIGGESTRPGASLLSVDEELERIRDTVEYLVPRLPVPVSIDTSKPEVMAFAASHGIKLINDVRALRYPGALKMAVKLQLPVCLMHMSHPHANDSISPNTLNNQALLYTILDFFHTRLDAVMQAGLARDKIILDPGFGGGAFGKTAKQSAYLLKNLVRFTTFDCPVLVGVSRKSFIGDLLKIEVEDRLPASIAAVIIACMQGVHLFRVHDVAATTQAITLYRAIMESKNND